MSILPNPTVTSSSHLTGTLTVRRFALLGMLGIVTSSLTPAASTKATAATVKANSTAISVASCEDVSPSFPSDVRLRFNEALISKLDGFAATTVSSPRKALPAKPAINIVIRPISKNSFASGNVVELKLDPLSTITVLRDDESAETTINRLRAKKLRNATLATNRAKAAAFALALRDWNPPVRRGSDVIGCVLAAATLLNGTERTLFIVSDLVATTDPIDAGVRLSGVKVVVIQTCTEATECMALRSQWEQQFRSMGATNVAFFRPEQINDSVKF